jgi:uncharacterized protein GlcG (DUF336 family)
MRPSEEAFMKRYGVALVAAAALVTIQNAFAQQGAKTLSADLAAQMVQAAVAKCRAEGSKITVKVVDASNVEKAFLHDEGAGAVTIEFAQAKINTVLLTGRQSGAKPDAMPELIKGASPKQQIFGGMSAIDPASGKLIHAIDAGGAVPIMSGTDLIGVIGVSGATSPMTDRACATAGIQKVADKLK